MDGIDASGREAAEVGSHSREEGSPAVTPGPGPEVYAIDPVGIGLALLGSLALLVAVFLPRVESAAFFAGIQQNTLIQTGDGWPLVAIAIGIAGAVYRSWRLGRRGWAVMVLAALAIAIAVYDGTSRESLTLYRIDRNGEPDILGGSEKAKPGVGIYLAGAGGVLALIGGLRMRRDSEVQIAPDRRSAATKTCPDCAETVLAQARVCKHCGYRFAPVGGSAEADTIQQEVSRVPVPTSSAVPASATVARSVSQAGPMIGRRLPTVARPSGSRRRHLVMGGVALVIAAALIIGVLLVVPARQCVSAINGAPLPCSLKDTVPKSDYVPRR